MLTLLLLLTSLGADQQPIRPSHQLAEITVISRRPEPGLGSAVAVDVLDPTDDQSLTMHANQLLDTAASVWVSRGSGQEHLTAIRSPVLTGAGACGAFLYLENGIPIRPPGFCNINNLFEINLEQAAAVEVLKGPGSALHGSNALHGAINVLMAEPGSVDETRLGLLLGEQQFQRFDGSISRTWNTGSWRLDTSLGSSGSFRQQESYDQQKLNFRYDTRRADAEVSVQLAATNLNQETAGFILGFESYRDPALRRANLNPEAYRDARSIRAASHWQWGEGTHRSIRITPFVRSSRMNFLQHFLPGKPLEENGQDSAGLQVLAYLDGSVNWDLGFDLDLADGFLRETQDRLTEGSAFLVETRPLGKHYDYQVDALAVAAFAQFRRDFAENWQLTGGLRVERLAYDYDNRMADGNAREDGTLCGFGGCLYNRPADRKDRFTQWVPKLALAYRPSTGSLAYLRLARGFRAPQATELYRLQRQQVSADIEAERLDAIEIGFKQQGDRLNWSAGIFYMRKVHFIFRDAAGFNVSNGRTRHRGVEASFDWQLAQGWRWSGNLAYARHSYAFDRLAGLGERIESGNRVDTAPKWLARSALDWRPGAADSARIEWVHQGGYFLDAANSHRYPGHDLLHLSWRHQFSPSWAASLQINNLGNVRYAERADFAFGNYRYFPGEGRNMMLALQFRSE